eukprot:3921163-Amphidinium_carterae.1
MQEKTNTNAEATKSLYRALNDGLQKGTSKKTQRTCGKRVADSKPEHARNLNQIITNKQSVHAGPPQIQPR